jgi:hypothetical protein
VTDTGPGHAGDANLGITTFLNGTLVSNITIDTSEIATDTIDYVATDSDGLTGLTPAPSSSRPIPQSSPPPTHHQPPRPPFNSAGIVRSSDDALLLSAVIVQELDVDEVHVHSKCSNSAEHRLLETP